MIVLPIVLGSALVVPNTNAPVADDGLASLASLSSLSVAALQEEEEGTDGLWHGSLNVGLSKSEGNAEIQTYALDAHAVREFEVHRYTIDALWYYAQDNNREVGGQPSTLIQRRALGSFKYDQFVAEKTYFWGNGLAETNFASALDLRWTIGAGIGQQWRDDDQWRVNTEIGLAYFDEEFDTGAQSDYLAARIAWDIWTQVTDTLVFGHFGQAFPSLDDADDFYGLATTYFETKLSERMTARLSWLINYDNTPAQIGGQSLKRVDNLYLLNVGWTF